MPFQVPIKKPIPQYPDITDPSLVGSWLNKRVANSARDFSAAGNDMTPTDMRWIAEGGGIFNGASSKLVKSISDFRSGDSQGTITAWIKRSVISADQSILCSADEGTTVYYFSFYIHSTNVIGIQQKDNDAVDRIVGSTIISIGSYFFVSLVSDGSAYSMNVNGEAEDLSILSGANNGDWFADTTNRDNIAIGALKRSSEIQFSNGDIRELNIYSEPKKLDWSAYQFEQGVPE